MSFRGQGVYVDPTLNVDGTRRHVRGYTTDILTDQALEWLVEFVGGDRVMLGTDLPYDMGDADPLGRIQRSLRTDKVRDRVAGTNALKLFGLAERI